TSAPPDWYRLSKSNKPFQQGKCFRKNKLHPTFKFIRSQTPAPAIAAKSPEAKTPVDASGQERRRSSLPAVADTAFFAEDLERKARLGARKNIKYERGNLL
ncbi:MAG: hypothetical protein EA358_01100, partial [Flavobacteriales bacterium]